MTQDTWIKQAALLKTVYTEKGFMQTRETTNAWYMCLKDLADCDVELAVLRWMQTSPFTPKPADIRSMVQRNTETAEDQMGAEAAWVLVRRAVQNSNYHAAEEFDALPELIRKAIGSPENLKEMAVMDTDEFETVEKAQFARDYRAATERSREDQRMSEPLRRLISERGRHDTISEKTEFGFLSSAT